MIWPFLMRARSVLHFIPGAEGLRDCMTYHGPTRARVAWRVMAEFSILHRRQGPSAFSEMAPQNGQTDITGGDGDGLTASAARFRSFGMVSKDRVMRVY